LFHLILEVTLPGNNPLNMAAIELGWKSFIASQSLLSWIAALSSSSIPRSHKENKITNQILPRPAPSKTNASTLKTTLIQIYKVISRRNLKPMK